MAGICDVPIISNVCDTVGESAATLVAAPFDWLAQAIGQAASWLFQGVWALFDSTTLVDITGAGYIGVYNVMFGIAIFLMLIFFCLQLITGLVRRDAGSLGRAALGLAKSVLGSFLVITLTATLLEIVDQLSVGIIQATGTTIEEMGGKIGVLVAGLTAINLTAPGAGAIITIFLSFLAICAAAIVWFSLLIRKALILVAVVMAPIALSGASWDATKGWFGKWASFVLALIFSKLVIVVVFLVAINQVNAPIDMDLSSIADPIAGIVLMFIAAFAPYMVYKFISFVGFDMYHVMSAEQESKQAMNRPVPMPGKAGWCAGRRKSSTEEATARVQAVALRHRVPDRSTPPLAQQEAAPQARAQARAGLQALEVVPRQVAVVRLPEVQELGLPLGRSGSPRSRARQSPRARQRPARSLAERSAAPPTDT